MWKLISNVRFGFQIAMFALVCLAASPAILFQFGLSWLREWIESRWPGNARGQAIGFWIELLTPIILSIILLIVLWFTVARMRARHSAS